SGAFVTIEVNKLTAADLVCKKINPVDRRRVQLTVTRKARKLLEDLTAIQQPTNDMLFANFTRQEFQFMRQIIARLVSSGDQALSLLDYLSRKEASL
ncbi:MAG: MarR family winged helix-turn-helix transcriptional regulator, partial [Hyphomicrobiaceae bacterium]